MKTIEINGLLQIRSEESGRLFAVYDPARDVLVIRRSGETCEVDLKRLRPSAAGAGSAGPQSPASR